jgi:aquaporin Z
MKMKDMKQDCKRYCAETLGTAILIFVGLGAGVIWGAFASGLAFLAIMFMVGAISGSHLNPAVSLGMALRKRISWKDFIFYTISQIVGALLGALILFAVLKIATPATPWTNFPTYELAGIAMWRTIISSLIFQTFIAFVFVLAFLSVTRKEENKKIFGFVIGLTLIAVIMAGGAVNPAGAFASAVYGGVAGLRQVWVFLVAPLLGGALAALVSWMLHRKDDEAAKKSVAKETK